MNNKLKNLTAKNTKQECIEAYNSARELIEELEKTKINPQAIIEKKEKEETIKQSDIIAEQNIINPSIIEEYNTLKKGIEFKKKEIEELTDIQAQANTLIALINASKDKEINLDTEYKQKKAYEQESFNLLKDSFEKEIEKLTLQKKEKEEEIKKYRLRDEEEYKYNFIRQKTKDNTEWEDVKAKREKELAEKIEICKLKEKELSDKLSELEQMKAEIESFPNRLTEAKAEGASAKEREMAKEYGYKKLMYEKEWEYKVNVLEEKFGNIESLNISLKNEKDVLQNKLDEAYGKIQLIATDTVKASGGVKILSNEKEK